MKFKKTLTGVGVAGALIAATAVAALPAVAQDDTDTNIDDGAAEATPFRGHHGRIGLGSLTDVLGIDEVKLRDRLMNGETVSDIATAEGVDVDAVVAALVAEAEDRLADAITDERITQEEADEKIVEIEARITDMVNGEAPIGAGHGFGHGPRGFFGLAEVADVLGLDATTLGEELRAGNTLTDIAAAQGVPIDDVKGAIVDNASARLESAVADGRITQEQADERIAAITDGLDSIVDGELPLGGARGFGHGDRGGFGPADGGLGSADSAAETANA